MNEAINTEDNIINHRPTEKQRREVAGYAVNLVNELTKKYPDNAIEIIQIACIELYALERIIKKEAGDPRG